MGNMNSGKYILVSRRKGTNEPFKNAGPYAFDKKSDFGSLAKIKRQNPGYEYKIVAKSSKRIRLLF